MDYNPPDPYIMHEICMYILGYHDKMDSDVLKNIKTIAIMEDPGYGHYGPCKKAFESSMNHPHYCAHDGCYNIVWEDDRDNEGLCEKHRL